MSKRNIFSLSEGTNRNQWRRTPQIAEHIAICTCWELRDSSEWTQISHKKETSAAAEMKDNMDYSEVQVLAGNYLVVQTEGDVGLDSNRM